MSGVSELFRMSDYCEGQVEGRIRYWKYIPELKTYLRVVTLEDGETVHNAFLIGISRRSDTMKFDYYKETDTLYIELSEKAGADAQEIHPGIVTGL